MVINLPPPAQRWLMFTIQSDLGDGVSDSLYTLSIDSHVCHSYFGFNSVVSDYVIWVGIVTMQLNERY